MAFLVGSVDQLAWDLLAPCDRWGLSLVTIAEAAMEQFAPVIALLRGE
ncbi:MULTISPECIES: hypothetical protein [unclassified Streptomyces]